MKKIHEMIDGLKFEYYSSKWVVKLVDNETIKKNYSNYDNYMGYTCYLTHTVFISTLYPESTYLSTLFHELTHVASQHSIGGSHDQLNGKIDIELQENLIGEFFQSLVNQGKIKVIK